MSNKARDYALALPLSDDEKRLIAQALGEG